VRNRDQERAGIRDQGVRTLELSKHEFKEIRIQGDQGVRTLELSKHEFKEIRIQVL
jgi:hypothetical protein